VSVQRGIFASGLGEGRNVDVDISGSDMQQIANAAAQMFGSLRQKIPQAQVRPVPSFELLYPEIRFLPDAQRLKSVGLSTAELGVILDVLMDGRAIGDFKPEGEKTFDLVLKGANDEVRTPEALYQALVITPQGDMVPVSSLAKMERTTGLNQIRHLEMKRTNTLQVTPPSDMPVQVAIEEIQSKIIEPMRGSGALEGLEINLSGTADKLAKTWAVLQSNFLIALIITYLLMSALFGNFLYPLVIMFTVPMAAAGGLLGLKVVNLVIAPQPLDILTMLGFIMLIGVVVNNAILIVHQALNNIRDAGMEQMEAIKESVRTRIRPIFMSATTSISGMLPLVLAPGPGSELYRGLGSVIIGGLALSTVFTVFLIPVLLIGLVKMEKPNHAQEETDKERERRAA
jgi:HAE1 family hydrophobic/amphiphilic exporter-1